ncbi:putative toxin-antitoxin system toxin component, PIN family [Pelotalea chapellei]|uniref:Toxin-antitoxin system toxin component, PIN family n=1 Tax=Pelotalea chapellei TaxID=44671 RepID=A0ABS5U4R7_9BACT|nr:putative toxin-antitoxin system toxin component, PIN family [Pelotalea chapellei]MBT1070665.1 putative toxin-antitoxin system toxin component, PIN family [Pelotalea chapellei]
MKVVIGTNVLVSAILRNRIPEAVILFVAGNDDMEWVVSPEIMAEYREVLSRPKFALPPEMLAQWFELLERFTVTCHTGLTIDFPRDQKDAKFLSCAIDSGADFFITGDRDFSQAQRLLTTTILSVTQFKTHICDRLMTPA